MGKVYEQLDEKLRAFIACQRMFFVASAPLSAAGHVNVSPKGLDSFRVLGPRQVAYLDLTGSGVETIAHARENQRMTIMFCAFDGPPKILRLYGRAQVLTAPSTDFDALRPLFPEQVGTRSIIRLDIERIADACGYAVPLFEFVAERDTLVKSLAKKGESTLQEYRRLKNQHSIDGLPGLDD
jgi:hypothetical protein